MVEPVVYCKDLDLRKRDIFSGDNLSEYLKKSGACLMKAPKEDWPKKLVEGGKISIEKYIRIRKEEKAKYGYHRWYGADPLYIKGVKSASRASDYEKIGTRGVKINSNQKKLLQKYRIIGRYPPYIPQPKGCFGFVWETLSAAYKLADKACDKKFFDDINKKNIAGDFTSLIRVMQTKHQWKVFYFTLNPTEVLPDEKRQINSVKKYAGIKIDDKIIFPDTGKLNEISLIDFWWGTLSQPGERENTTNQGVHFFSGSRGDVTELIWEANPWDPSGPRRPSILKKTPLKRFLKSWLSGIIVIPPEKCPP